MDFDSTVGSLLCIHDLDVAHFERKFSNLNFASDQSGYRIENRKENVNNYNFCVKQKKTLELTMMNNGSKHDHFSSKIEF